MRGLRFSLLFLYIVIVAPLCGGCGGSAIDRARRDLTVLQRARQSVAEGLAAFDGPNQQSLVAEALAGCKKGGPDSCADRARASVTAYRAERAKVNQALLTFGGALAVAQAGIDLAEATQQRGFDPTPLIAPVATLAAQLNEMLIVLGVFPRAGTAPVAAVRPVGSIAEPVAWPTLTLTTWPSLTCRARTAVIGIGSMEDWDCRRDVDWAADTGGVR